MTYTEKFYFNIIVLAMAYGFMFANLYIISILCATISFLFAIYLHSLKEIKKYQPPLIKCILLQWFIIFFLGLHRAFFPLPYLVICNTYFSILWCQSSYKLLRSIIRYWFACFILYVWFGTLLPLQAFDYYFSNVLFPKFALNYLLATMFVPILVCYVYFYLFKAKHDKIIFDFQLKYKTGDYYNHGRVAHTTIYSKSRSI